MRTGVLHTCRSLLAERMMAACHQWQPKLKPVLVVGDVMTDIYVYGHLEDTCQEHCPKFVEESRATVPGGAGNAKRGLEGWRVQVVLLGQTHGPVKTRFMVGDKCLARHDADRWPGSLEDLSTRRKQAHLAAESGLYSAVLLSDYDKGMLTPQLIRGISLACKAQGIPCVADCKREPALYEGCTLKCNFEWFSRNSVRYMQPNLVVTYGPQVPSVEGQLAGRPQDLPPVKCVNHVGAGDCFAAHLTLGLACGLTLVEAAAVAHSAGRVYVQRPHNCPPTPEAVRADLAVRPPGA